MPTKKFRYIATTEFNTKVRRKEENVLFNDALNTFYLRLYGVGHMVKDTKVRAHDRINYFNVMTRKDKIEEKKKRKKKKLSSVPSKCEKLSHFSRYEF